ncbi:MAG TPA: hypothetical protein PK034_04095 [Rugosibacter sp.]|nr:hypothetical protein [Rugosibacter sp.]
MKLVIQPAWSNTMTHTLLPYFLGRDAPPCPPPKGTAGTTGLFLSCLGFFCSRLLRIWPLAMMMLLEKVNQQWASQNGFSHIKYAEKTSERSYANNHCIHKKTAAEKQHSQNLR